MYAFLKSHHNCAAYVDEQKERKSTFFTAFEHREKEACLLHNIDIAVVSECLCHLKAQYLIQSPNICSGKQILFLYTPSASNGMASILRS